MKDRLKKLRRTLDLTQVEFAERIGSVQNTITGYESGRRNPSNPVISSICKEFNVNETWLRTGEGEMFNPAPSSELDALAEKYGLSGNARILIERFLELKKPEQDVVIDFIQKAAASMVKKTPAPGFDIEAKVAEYRRELEEQLSHPGSSLP